MGDVLLTVPTIRAIRERFPHACVAAPVPHGPEAMLTRYPCLGKVLVWREVLS